MNTRQRLEYYRHMRSTYMAECRSEFGYRSRAQAKVLGSSGQAGFISALFGSAFMIALYATFDFSTCIAMIKYAQQTSLADMFHLLTRNLMG